MGDTRIKVRRRRQLRQLMLVLGSCLVLYCLFFILKSPSSVSQFPVDDGASPRLPWPWPLSGGSRRLSEEKLNNLSLGEAECRATFPGLTTQIDEVVAQGPFTLKNTGDGGPLQGRIKDGHIYILHAQRKADLSREMVNSRTSSLHQLHRAILTSPAPLPDTVFTLNFQDQPFGTAWTYSRQADPNMRPKDPNARSFLMPHFSFWAWDLPFIGSMSRATGAITSIEQHETWSSKIPRAVWRGTAWYNSVHSPQLRQKLLAATKNKPWADVQSLQWTGRGDRDATNALPIEGFCRYRYVVHTEGVTYSGRFQYHQMCASVVLTPPINWLQHTTHMVRPLFSSSMDLDNHPSGAKLKGLWITDRHRRTWPVQYPPDQANIIFVAPDWSDLGETIAWLEDHPRVAEGIARRQRELFVGGGYFSPAAEACYWRALMRGWASVASVNKTAVDEGRWAEREGVRYEEFTLSNGD
ncbi:glycosyl transferase family 90-domain-containing protein [Apodospora peruviana]|uniref:Glycosyl transferase family 90-domain-containing protein n=1 Tax=Apodospora peruviana TaxID=516989 RepID=A0AAE0M2G3_9PEZI|nr:glycosyl transferase family 90-domain-containing protein [Apodospora peruviana]